MNMGFISFETQKLGLCRIMVKAIHCQTTLCLPSFALSLLSKGVFFWYTFLPLLETSQTSKTYSFGRLSEKRQISKVSQTSQRFQIL